MRAVLRERGELGFVVSFVFFLLVFILL